MVKIEVANELPFITKLIAPRTRADVVHRAHLFRRLQEGIEMRLQVVHGGAGFGKTTLLSSFFHSLKLPACWYTLDPSDGDPKVFFSYLLAGLEKSLPLMSERIKGFGRGLSKPSQNFTLPVGQLVTMLQESGIPKLVLFWDDYHTIEDTPAATEVVAPLIERSPSCLHIIIASRTSPKIAPLPTLLARREAALIGEDDLRLNLEETGSLLNILWGRPPEPSEIERVYAKSEGWSAGVVLTSTARDPLGPNAPMTDFLTAEILDSQPPHLQDFMLRTSIPEELTPDLCTHLTDCQNAEELLAELSRRNTLLHWISDSTLRYHQLLRTVLQDTLRQRNHTLFINLNIKAGHYFAERNLPDRAISHFMAGDAPHLAADISEKVVEATVDRGHWHTAVRWLNLLPEEVLSSRPRLLMQQARCAMYMGEPAQAIDRLNSAAQLFHNEELIQDEAIALMTRSRAFRFQGAHTLSLKDAKAALRISNNGDCSQEILASAHRHLGLAYAHYGKFPTAKKHFLRAVKLLEGSTERFETGLSNAALGTLYYHLGKLPEAIVYYRKAHQIWLELANEGELAETLNNMAVLFGDLGEVDTALQLAQEAVQKAEQSGYHRVKATALLTSGDLLLLKGEYASSREQYLEGISLGREVKEAQVVAYGTAALGQCYRVKGEIRKAIIFLEEAIKDAESRNQSYELGIYSSILGALTCDQGEPRRAQKILAHACQLLEGTGSRRDIAVAHWRHGYAYYLDKKYGKAIKSVDQVASLCNNIGASGFLLAEAILTPRLTQYILQTQPVSGTLTQFANQLASASVPTLQRRIASPEKTLTVTNVLPTSLKAFVLGDGEVYLDGGKVTPEAWESEKAKELFFFIILSAEKRARKEEIITALWPDSTVSGADSAFHSALHRARRATDPNVLVFRNRSYQLDSSLSLWTDVSAFDQLLTEASQIEDDTEQLEKLQRAIELYKNPLLPWCYNDWCEERRNELERKYALALFTMGSLRMRNKEWPEAIEVYQRAWEKDPYSETSVYSLMKCYAAIGNINSAVDVYRRYQDILIEEPGLTMASTIQHLYRQLSDALTR